MFKLKNILNAGTNVPEPEVIFSQSAITLEPGSTALCENGIISQGKATTKPSHITIRQKEKGEDEALCYRITPNMIFEVEVVGDNVKSLLSGDCICLYNTGSGFSKCSDVIDGGVACIVDMNGATKSGDTVYVSFI